MYAIKTQNGLLNGFYTNDLPTTNKLYFNENTDKFEPKFTLRNMLNCSGGHMIFDSQEEAEDYINYLKNKVNEDRKRYEISLKGSTDRLLDIINKFKVVCIK